MIIKKTIRNLGNRSIKETAKFINCQLTNFALQRKKINVFYCNLCSAESPYFLHTSNEKRILKNSICPNCSSRKRHRGIYQIYKKKLTEFNNPKILHFAPEPVFYQLFSSYNYITADSELADVNMCLNIQDIDCKSRSFDIILSNHVLEHVKDDLKALSELSRILKHNGLLILTVPGDWQRNKTIEYNFPDRNGHYRDYGLDFINILNSQFGKVDSEDLYKYNNHYDLPLGLTPKHDLAFLCHKV